MKARITWVVIADGARACFLENRGPGSGLVDAEIPDLENNLRRTAEMGSDRPGRTHDSHGTARHALAPRVDWHEFEKQRFAKEVAAALDRAALAKDFDRLVLVAPPKILGTLRATLKKQTLDLVTGELAKDLTNHAPAALPAHLESVLLL